MSAPSEPTGRAPDRGGLGVESPHDRAVDMHELHAPIMREKTRPSDGMQPIPLGLIFAFGALLMWGGWYLGAFSGGWRADVFAPGAEPAEPAGAVASKQAAAQTDPVADLRAVGRRVYAQCSACHQSNGRGLAGVFPPLVGSDWVTGSEAVLVRILLHGMQGPVEVAGAEYNGVMPAWAQLSDEEIAGVLTYIRSSWDNDAAPVEPASVAAIREAEAGRSEAWTAEALRTLDEADG